MDKLELAFLVEGFVEPHKVNTINALQLIASVEDQDEYNRTVPIANVADELVSQWFDDSFLKEFDWFKEFFSEEEWIVLSEFDRFYEQRLGKLPDNYSDLRENYFWKEIIGKANWALDMLNWRDVVAKYDD